MSETILLVEDEKDQRLIIESILSQAGYRVTSVASAEEAIKCIHRAKFDIVLSDWKLPEMNGEQLLNEIIDMDKDIGFILITAHSDPSHAIKLMRAGADDYLPKPFDQQSLLFTVNKLVHLRKLNARNIELEKQNSHRQRLAEMIGQSEVMNRLFTRIIKAAPSDANLLISGESGTGKELAARAIYQLSNRKQQIFMPVNCAAIPENLAESELFGAEKGSFTGASQRRIGKLEASHQGTIFLDEIGELPLLLQSKLLRFLQEGTISRIGSNKEIKLDVRVIAATNRDLSEEIKHGNFREDLYYRLNVIPVKIPPLRQRNEDIPLLINQFLEEFSDNTGKGKIEIDKAALKLLIEYP
ncbi:MAG: sigma-54 dependent transcriptional regulator [Enterobacterales bacterium]|nr:sigma-54 dependent transcriptional regulator [Enterobacterales bacterium]